MSFFMAAAIDPEEKPLYDRLRQLFYTHPDVIRSRRLAVPDHVIHTIRNKRTGNSAVVKDFRSQGKGVQLRIYERKAHIAANIEKEQELVIDTFFPTIDDPSMISIIYDKLTKESEFSQTPFRKIKATKKPLEKLDDDEVFAGRIVKLTTLETKDGPAYDMQFENSSGTLIEMQNVVHRITTNPIGQYVVINRRRKTIIVRPQKFLEGYEITESDDNVTRPADLIP